MGYLDKQMKKLHLVDEIYRHTAHTVDGLLVPNCR
jgi:hypothetical protein